jgi:hypothetical protein
MSAYVSVFAALLGALVYILAGHAKAAELGRLTFGAGALAFLLGVAGHTVKVLG